jgi:transcriptional regulator GlxA family with amidase domain
VDSWDRPRDNTANLAHAQQIRRAIEKMTANPAEACSLSSLARETGMSAFHFARIFSALVGLSPHQYLLQLRIRRAAAMLREGASVMQAAVGSGFENVAHFSRTFQRRMGMSPSRYPSGR